MSLPHKIKIGAITFDVSYRDKIHLSEDDPDLCSGAIDIAASKILIQGGFESLAYEKVVLLHEIWHGILEQTSFDWSDEGLMDTLAYKTLELILDNPKLIKYLQKVDANDGSVE